ncbi:MAG: hypothetical protein ACE5NG_00925 [bacterium]
MSWTIFPERADRYPAPREDPLKYPGERPPTGFILANRMVWPIIYSEKDKGSVGATSSGRVLLDSSGESVTINKFLESRKAVPLQERFAVIGYGSNPVPGQLLSKFGAEAVVPVIFGTLKNSDVVYNLISNMGYAFAEIIIGEESTEGNVGVTFLDHQQLLTMVKTEQNYHLAYSPSEVRLESGEQLPGGKGNALYIFAGFRKIWVPSGYNGPIPIAERPSPGRKRKPLTQIETLSLVIEQFNLGALGIHTPCKLAQRIKEQAQLEEKPGKLKYDLQKAVEEDPRSFPSLADSLTLVENSSLPPKPFGAN